MQGGACAGWVVKVGRRSYPKLVVPRQVRVAPADRAQSRLRTPHDVASPVHRDMINGHGGTKEWHSLGQADLKEKAGLKEQGQEKKNHTRCSFFSRGVMKNSFLGPDFAAPDVVDDADEDEEDATEGDAGSELKSTACTKDEQANRDLSKLQTRILHSDI